MGSYIYSALYNTRHCTQAQPRCQTHIPMQATLSPGAFAVFQLKAWNIRIISNARKMLGRDEDILASQKSMQQMELMY
jgi:hypothetical protein